MDRVQAQLRIFCDNDNRWVLKPDRLGDPSPNSRRTNPDEQEWIDERNQMSHRGRTCKTGPTILARAYTKAYNEDGSNDPTDHITITVSDQRPKI